VLSQADNELLCRVGPETPMGALFRRFWLPALMPSELPEADCPPVRMRLLGEDLVAFRDTTGAVGVVAENCPHRGASLFFGRNEEVGLRCVYHGWKFDTSGTCVDMPNEPPESNFKPKVRVTAYRTAEWGGLIWVYMGPGELEPELPRLDWCLVSDTHRQLGKWISHSNFAQGLEGNIDSSHVSFLHRDFGDGGARGLMNQDGAPQLTVKETDFGFVYGARRNGPDGQFYWRLTPFMLPSFTLVPNPSWPRTGHCVIPVDDEHSIWFSVTYSLDEPIPQSIRDDYAAGLRGQPRLKPGTFEPIATAANDYLIDRQIQKDKNFTGIINVREQDMAIVETMGPILNRTIEHVGTADLAIIAYRRLLLRLARSLQDGRELYAPYHGDIFRVRTLDVVDAEPQLGTLMEAHKDKFLSLV
jgi:phthalate 4,5-dioxygenase